MSNKNKEPFWIKLKNCIFDFEKYPEMAAKNFNEVITYLLKLIAIIVFIISLCLIYFMSQKVKTGVENLKNKIPNFTFENNILISESNEETKIDTNNLFNKVIINTKEIEEEKVKEYINDINNSAPSVILLKDKLIINVDNVKMNEISYEEISKSYDISKLAKEDIIEYISKPNTIYLGAFVLIFIVLYTDNIISILLDAFLLSCIGYLTALITKIRIKYTAMYKIAVYSLTLPSLLKMIYEAEKIFFNYDIKYFEVMYITVAYIYIITSIFLIKTEIIKRQGELMKIVDEEAKVREELKRQEELKKQDENKKEDNKNKKDEKEKDDSEIDDKKEKEDNKKDNDGKEPQGENA